MKHKFYSFLLTALLGMTGMNAWAQDYEISSAQDLVDFAEAVNTGETGANAVLTQDINLDGVAWTPIGNATNIYTGTFDGQGFAITNFSYTATSDYNGLFGFIKDATVKNFSISGSLTSDGYTKNGVIGNANGTSKVSGIYSSLNITLANKGAHSGGIVGGDDGATTDVVLVEGCEYSGTMTHTGAGDCQAGILGYTGYGGVKNCIFSGTIIGETNTKYGGILGYTRRNTFLGVQNCLSIGKIVAPDGCTTAAAIIANYNGSATTTVKNNYYCLAEGSTTTLAIGNKASSCEAPVAVTAAQLTSGEVCYLLNGDQSNIAFYQTLIDDEVPTLDATHDQVYMNGRQHCNGDAYAGTFYSNTNQGIVTDEHDYVGGFCSYCNQLDESFDGDFLIGNATQLKNFATFVNAGNFAVNAKLTADIDMNGITSWIAIGNWGTTPNGNACFKGHFNGQGHSIKNFNYNSEHNYYGLFGVISAGALIENFSIYGAISTNIQYAGGVAAYARDSYPTIRNVHSCVNINNTYSGGRQGGILGGVLSTVDKTIIENCAYSGTLQAGGLGGNYGGIVGYVNNNASTVVDITNCLFDGTLNNGTANGSCGGIVGYNNGGVATIKNSLSLGSITSGAAGQFFGTLNGNNSTYAGNNYYVGIAPQIGSGTPKGTAPVTATSEQLASGEICYLLNGSVSGGTNWLQTLVDDDYPTPYNDGNHDPIYMNGHQHCDGTAYAGASYSNDDLGMVTDDHDFADGFCTYCSALDATYMTANADGDFEIDTPNQLKWFAVYANEVDHAANAVLTDDIDLTGVTMSSIGTTSAAYNGKFNGQGHSISGFEMTTDGRGGLFGDVTNATIKNFSISGNLTVTGGTGSGLIAWATGSTISNVHSALVIKVPNSGVHHVGGVVGSARGSNTIDRCSFSGSMTVADGSTDNFAGIVSYVTNTSETVYDNVTNCANYGNITFVSTGCAAGGVVGYVNASYVRVKNCLNTGIITCTGGTPTFGGAIVGRLRGHTPAYLTNNFWYEDSAEGAGKDNNGNINLESAESVTTEQLANGYVAARMAPYIRQNVGTDATPVLDPTHNVVAEITAAEYATLYVPDANVTIPTGVEAYTGEFATNPNNGKQYLAMNDVKDIIPAETAVVLKGAEGIYQFAVTTEEPVPDGALKLYEDEVDASEALVKQLANISGNVLKGTADDIDATGKYILAKPAGEPVCFYLAESGTIKAGKAYLEVPAGTDVKAFYFSFGDDDATGLSDMSDMSDQSDIIFNLAGQRLQKMQKGINIIGGQKVLK